MIQNIKLKSSVIVYDGGGYDGCISEPNVFYVDYDMNFHNIFSSGSLGIDTEYKVNNMDMEKRDAMVYPLTIEGVKKLNEDINIVLQLKIAKFINELHDEDIVWTKCDKCGKTVFPKESDDWTYDPVMIFVNFRGIGGIRTFPDDIVCDECYSERTCSQCGEYFDEGIKHIDEYGEPICEYCKEDFDKLKDII